jgi:hypothetical protein
LRINSDSRSKRIKTEVEQPYKKHAVHWAPDGSVLVQIKDVRFKLHRSRLVKHSGWFRDFLEREDPSAGLDMEGDGRVILLDDVYVTISDFDALLNALEDFVYVIFLILPNTFS